MKNVTIKLDEKTVAWARVYAALNNTSVSRLVGEMLAARMKSARQYEAARRQYRAQDLRPLRAAGESYPGRDQLYDRPGLR